MTIAQEASFLDEYTTESVLHVIGPIFQIWSTPDSYEELPGRFEPIRNGKIFWMNNENIYTLEQHKPRFNLYVSLEKLETSNTPVQVCFFLFTSLDPWCIWKKNRQRTNSVSNSLIILGATANKWGIFGSRAWTAWYPMNIQMKILWVFLSEIKHGFDLRSNTCILMSIFQ